MKLIILDSTVKSIKAKLSSVASTNQPTAITAWADSTATTFIEGSTEVDLNDTSFVTLVASPAAYTRRVIKGISFHNTDTAPVEISLVYDSDGTERVIAKINLLPDATWTLDGIEVTSGSIEAIIANTWIVSETDPVFAAWLAATPPAFPGDIPIKAIFSDVITGTDDVKYITPKVLAEARRSGIRIFNVEDYGAVHDGVTDDTVAIQAAIQACYDAGGGIVYFPNGIYVIGGALQTSVGGVNYNSQLYIPIMYLGTDRSRRSITFLGESVPNMMQSLGLNTTPVVPSSGVIWKSTIIGSGTNPSVISAGLATGGTYLDNNDNDVHFENIQVQPVPNGSNQLTIGAINLRRCRNSTLKNTSCFPWNLNLYNSGTPQNLCAGIQMPLLNCEHINVAENCNVGGFSSGIVAGEHTVLFNTVAMCCLYGYEFTANYHVAIGYALKSFWNANDVKVSGGTTYMRIDSLQIEWQSIGKWYDSQYTVLDASNYGKGSILYHIVEAGVGVNQTKFSKSGGTNLSFSILGDSIAPETSTTIGALINGATAKTTPVDADMIGLMDGAASNILKKLSWANIKATLKTYFDTLYQAVLVSGTNIKTINGNSLLGSGDVAITGGIADAPADSKTYGRNNNAWAEVSAGGGVSDAPSDGTIYGRQNAAWVPFGAGGGSSFWTLVAGTPVRTSNTTFTLTGDLSAFLAKGLILKWTESAAVKVAMVSIPSTYSSPNTTVTIIGDIMASIDASSLKYCLIGVEAFVARFGIAGNIGAVLTDVANVFYATEPYRVIGSDLQVGTAGTTNSTTVDINKNGTTMYTTKPTLATTIAKSPTPFTADSATSLALGDRVSIDIDAIQTTNAVDLYVQLYLFPTRYLNL